MESDVIRVEFFDMNDRCHSRTAWKRTYDLRACLFRLTKPSDSEGHLRYFFKLLLPNFKEIRPKLDHVDFSLHPFEFRPVEEGSYSKLAFQLLRFDISFLKAYR